MVDGVTPNLQAIAGQPDPRSSYDKLSSWYDLVSGPSEARWRDLASSNLHIVPGEVVLEIGFGTGHGLVELVRRTGTAGSVFGVDLSIGMCHVTKRRIGRLHGPRPHILQAGAAELPFSDARFSAILMSFTLELFDDDGRERVLAECLRVLGSGGRIGVVSLDRRGTPTIMTRLYDWAGRRLPQWIDCHPIPVAASLSASGFSVTGATEGAVGGLPLAVIIAEKSHQ